MALRAELGLARSPGISYQELLDTDSPGARRAAAGVAPLLGEPTSRSSATHRGSGTAAKSSGSGCGSGSSPAARSTSRTPATTSSTTSPSCRSSCCVTRTGAIKAYPQRLPASRPPAEGLRRALLRTALPVPRLRLGARRQPAGRARRAGTSRMSHGRRLPPARGEVGTWAGFVFINPDPTQRRSRHFVGDLAEQFAVWDLDRYYKAHVAKVIKANWKIAQEAFCEAYHVERDPPADPAVPRRHQLPGRRLGQLRPRDHAGRHAEPAARLGRPREDEMLRAMLDVPRSTRSCRSRSPRVRPRGRSARRLPASAGARSSAIASSS